MEKSNEKLNTFSGNDSGNSRDMKGKSADLPKTTTGSKQTQQSK
jgi:hypothetical protein